MINRQITYDTPPKKGLSQQDLEQLLKHWQGKLNMDDWRLDLKIVDFKRGNGYRQSGDFIATPEEKTATILMTWDPWRGDEEYVLLHELLHSLIYDFDRHCEKYVLYRCATDSDEHAAYMGKLENVVHHLTRAFLGRPGPEGIAP